MCSEWADFSFSKTWAFSERYECSASGAFPLGLIPAFSLGGRYSFGAGSSSGNDSRLDSRIVGAVSNSAQILYLFGGIRVHATYPVTKENRARL